MAQSASLVIGIAFALWILALLTRIQDRSWVSPASIFALIWAAYVPTLLFFVPSAQPFLAGMLWILISVAVTWVGSAIAGALVPPLRARDLVPSPRAIATLRHLARWPILIGLADAVWLFAQRGFSSRDLFSFSAIMLVSSVNRGEAYAGESDTPVFERLAFTAMYLGALYGGLLFRLSDERRDKILAFGTLFVLILINTLHGSRFGSIYGGAFWLSACLAAHVALADPKKGVGSRFLFVFGAGGVVIVFALSMVTMIVRYTIFSGENTNPVSWWYMFSDPFGFIAAFGIWFGQSGLHPDGPLLGARVFRRIAGLWGRNYPLYDAVDVGFNSSNVFTIFRELIEDFTPVGSLVLLLFYGFAGRLAFWGTMRDDNRLALPALATVYICAFTSVASSAFGYTTITVATLMFAGTCYLLPRIAMPRFESPELNNPPRSPSGP